MRYGSAAMADDESELSAASETALRAAVRNGVPDESVAAYARWWQLETWLRTLVYVELRSRFGDKWIDRFDPVALTRSARDADLSYMPSPDQANPISYLDVGYLFELIEEHWGLFEPSLIGSLTTWKGRVEDISHVRHRLAHCRRPHRDDRGRIEQILRDLEPGARRAVDAYNDPYWPSAESSDPVVSDWLGKEHEVAARLIEHGRDQYGIHFHLTYSVRPWAERPADQNMITGSPGVLWEWSSPSDKWIDPVRYWQSSYVQSVASSIVHVLIPDPFSVKVTIPAVESPQRISQVIAATFEALFVDTAPVRSRELRVPDELWDRHQRRGKQADSRVLIQDPFAVIDSTAPEMTIFSA